MQSEEIERITIVLTYHPVNQIGAQLVEGIAASKRKGQELLVEAGSHQGNRIDYEVP